MTMTLFNNNKTKFSLYLCDCNEYLFGGYNSVCYIDLPIVDNYKAKIYICSNGIFIEPTTLNDSSIYNNHIIRILYRNLLSVKPTVHNSLIIQTNQYIKQINDKLPWEHYNNHDLRLTLQLNSNDLSIVLQLINQCNMCSRLTDIDERNTLINDIIQSFENITEFNISNIVDLTEKSILTLSTMNTQSTKSVNNNILHINLIQPLISISCLLYITNKRIYIQPINNAMRVIVYELQQFDCLYKRRYNMKYNSIELMLKQTNDKQQQQQHKHNQSIYIQFDSIDQCNAVYLALSQYIKPINVQQQLTKLVKQWQSKQIDNYTYLLNINKLAGRSYNDLSQYPIFPWILTDYTSNTIDINNISIYRNLSQPIGRLNEQRFVRFKERYIDLQAHMHEPNSLPPFLYGVCIYYNLYMLFICLYSLPTCSNIST